MKKRVPKKRKLITIDELIKKADEWDKTWLEVTVHALEIHDRDEVDELRREFLSHKNRGAFHLTNHHSKRLWVTALLQSFLNSRSKLYGRGWQDDLQYRKVACALITFTHKGWACADTNIQFDLKRAKQKVRAALAKTNFIANFEAAPYRDEKWETGGESGKLISFHCHAIAWSGSLSGLRRLQKRIQGRFKPLLGKERGVHLKELPTENDLAGTVVYLAKMPVLGKRIVPTNGRRIQRDSRVTFSTRRQLFHALKDYSTFDFWLAGGEGKAILRRPRNKLKKQYRMKELRLK